MKTAHDILNSKNDNLRKFFDGIALSCQPNVIADVGAYTGEESARFRKLVPSAECHLFEANSQNVDEYILKRSDLDGVTINNFAVTDYDGEITFNVPVINSDAEKWRRMVGSTIERSDHEAVTRATVSCKRLDTYFAKEIASKQSFLLWVDVEGGLDKVLSGATQVLSQTIAILAEVEREEVWVGQSLADANIASLQAAGFILVADTYTPDATYQSDILCINSRWLELVHS